MERLVLFRHGKAEAHAESGRDFDRKLTHRGERESAEIGERLAQMGVAPDLALVSAAQRTRETWDAARSAFGEVETRYEDQLFHASADGMLRLAQEAGEGRGTVLMVGHNPSVHELTLQLMAQAATPLEMLARAQRQFPTAATAVFRFEPGGSPVAEALLFPERWN